jgi:hypothetical protein
VPPPGDDSSGDEGIARNPTQRKIDEEAPVPRPVAGGEPDRT